MDRFFNSEKATDRIIDEYINELILYTRKTETEIIDLIKNAMNNRNNEWFKYSQTSVIDFHRMTELSMYCLTKWNSEERYQFIKAYIAYIAKKHGGKMLDFGGGIGDLTILLANQGSNVDFLEVPSHTLNYAKWRFKRRFLDVHTYTTLNKIKTTYDVIIVLDVFEVLEKPEAHLQKFYTMLNPNGLLITSIPEFNEKDHPMNLIKNKDFFDKFESYCNELGFADSFFENKMNLKIKQKRISMTN